MKVRFNVVEEFLEELRLDGEAGAIADGIVRVTKRRTLDGKLPGLEHLQVVATYVARSQVVTLERYVGLLYGSEHKDKRLWERADEIHSLIEQTAKELGLEVRAGVIMDREEQGKG